MEENSRGSLQVEFDSTLLTLIIASCLMFLFIIFLINKDIFKLESKNNASDTADLQLVDQEDTSLNKFFERNFRETETETGLDEEECLLFDQVVREGTVNFGTTCIDEDFD